MSKWVTVKGIKEHVTKPSQRLSLVSSKIFKSLLLFTNSNVYNFFSSNRQGRFIKSLPPSISKDKEFCANLHKIFVDKTGEAIKENFANVEDQVKLFSKLNQLQNIVNDDNNKSEPEDPKAWRPLDSALDNQAAHDRKSVIEAKHKLQKEVLKPLQNEVNDLEKQVADLSYKIAENASKINGVLFNQDS